ncbi:hypothetical protein SAMN02910447_01670 [Ruminococcus sp. YE71]|uniref:hypothetical protein n=1 Tax=unclassified Ruminococcus TaxID=2608920 RepID=UPI0008854A6F|nr:MULTISPECIES: hypothetical protein [unclassified Ruminococcus]SDA20041.1 hypothetical protein SAMN02910446_01671 [Ruminococcus sp. YE78]SFW31746.1 hypothetical protein SAMN02910447_01670 [Ruminococcus sp. YE71]
MQISYNDVLTNGLACAGIVAEKAKFDGSFSIEKYKSLRFPYILQTEYAKEIIAAMIMGSIMEYHNQLREVLLESGIEIGDGDMESTVLRDGFLEHYNFDDSEDSED